MLRQCAASATASRRLACEGSTGNAMTPEDRTGAAAVTLFRRGRGGLRGRLFLAHLLVIAAGMLTLLATTLVLAPTLFERLMSGMMGSSAGMGDMMGGMEQSVTAAFRAAMLQSLLLSVSAAAVTAVVVSLVVAGRIVGPIERLLAASRRIAAGQYAQRVPVEGRDELAALAEQFNQMATALEEAERRRVALLGDVAHELRTPLATIAGYTEGLLDGVVAPEAATFALLHDEADRLRRLVRDLQELSRAEAHQLPIQPRAVAPGALVERALAVLEPQFTDKQIGIERSFSADLPAVEADADRIVQVLINLLGNALRSTSTGGSVRIAVERGAHTVVFHIADSGVGIASEHLQHLFERFYRVDKARSRALGGSGIGLTIAKAVVEAHGGQIWVASAGAGQGATFSFSLPCAV